MSNETLTTAGACRSAPCTSGKICVEDEDGYKCCRSRKKCVVRCKDPGNSPHSTRVPDVRDPPKFSPRERIIFRCSDYYRAPDGMQRTLKCLENGTWSRKKPVCYYFGDSALESNRTSLIRTTAVPYHEGHGSVVAISILSCVLILAIFILFYLYVVRWRHQRHWDTPLRCRKPSRQVPLESSCPTMPENLEEGAVPITDFAQHVAARHSNGDELFQSEFEDIQKQPTKGLLSEASMLDENLDKNRYTNISAYDHSRVHLQTRRRHQSNSSDYINANFVSSYDKPKAYIACQGPLPDTFADFWQMVWENNVTVIVMITNLIEKGRRKCDQYWPQDGREQYKNFAVILKDEDIYANYTVRTLQLRDLKQSKRRSYSNERRVLQYHYTQWPDHGTPEYILPLLTFIRRSTSSNADHTAPIVVHCSAGVGRSGAYIMLDSMIKMAQSTQKININKFLKFIRTQRNHLVQTSDQYSFLFDALLCHLICGNTECPGQQLKDYVNTLTKPVPVLMKNTENGMKILSENPDPKQIDKTKTRTGMENQFLIVARQVVRTIDYDFAKRQVNETKNRSDGILPIFHSRVPLNYRIGSEGSDYINASYLQGYRNGKAFIITQLPMPNTQKDFWSLVWDHNCSIIITIRDSKWNEQEDVYWPPGEEPVACPLCNVSSSSKVEEKRTFGKFIITSRGFVLEATKDDYVLSTTQIDINFWPGIDQLDSGFTQLLNYLDRTLESKDGSVIIHDRFGGTAAAQLACAHTLHQQLANEYAVDVFQTVRVAHQMRPRIFQSATDLHFLYKAMLLETHPSRPQNRSRATACATASHSTSDKTPLLTKVESTALTDLDHQTLGSHCEATENSEKISVATKESDVTITNDLDDTEAFEESATSASSLLA